MESSFVDELRCVRCAGHVTLCHSQSNATMDSGSRSIHEGVLICSQCSRGYLVRDGIPHMCTPSRAEAEQIAQVSGSLARVDDPDLTVEHRLGYNAWYEGLGDLKDHDALDRTKSNVELTRLSTEKQIESILRGMPRSAGMRILDHGCGFGFDLDLYSKQRSDARLFGFDVSAHMLRNISRRGVRARVALAFAEALPFPDGFFDFVASHEVLEHVPNPKMAFQEMARVLKPGGRAVITTPNGDSAYQRLLEPLDHRYQKMKRKPGPTQEVDLYDVAIPRRKFTRLAREAGLEIDRWEYTCPLYLTLTRLTPKLRATSEAMARLASMGVARLYEIVPRLPGIRSIVCEQVSVFMRKPE